MRLYIRHGEKAYDNGKSDLFPLDPPLTEEGKREAYQFFPLLMSLYGAPERIIASPFLRTRETAAILSELSGVPVEIDIMVGEYVSVRHPTQDALHPDTLEYEPIHPETRREFHHRIGEHVNQCDDEAWYITHGLFIQRLAERYNYDLEYPDPLCGMVIDEGQISPL